VSNALFLYRNRIDDATASQSSAALDADDGSSLGAARLQDPMLSRIARTARAESEWWRFTWAETVAIDTVALWKHNFSQDGVVPLKLYGDAGMSSLLYDQEHFAWPAIYGFGEAPLDEMTIGGLPIRTELDDDVPFTLIRLGQVYNVGALDFGMRDPGNPDYHVDGGRMIAGRAFSPEINYDLNWEYDVDSADRRDDLDGGGVSIVRGASWRVARLNFSFLSRAEGNTFLMDMKRRLRQSAELLAILQPDRFPEESRTAIYGVFNRFGPLRKTTPRHYAVDMEIREIAA